MENIEMTIQEKVKQLKKTMGFNESYIIKNEYDNIESWLDSEDSKEYYREWEHIRGQDKRFFENTKFDFIDHNFYVTEDNLVFHSYTLKDENLKMIEKMNVSFSSLSNGGLNEAGIYPGFIAVFYRGWDNTKKNRKIISDKKIRVI